jgi:hypothetical protein
MQNIRVQLRCKKRPVVLSFSTLTNTVVGVMLILAQKELRTAACLPCLKYACGNAALLGVETLSCAMRHTSDMLTCARTSFYFWMLFLPSARAWTFPSLRVFTSTAVHGTRSRVRTRHKRAASSA